MRNHWRFFSFISFALVLVCTLGAARIASASGPRWVAGEVYFNPAAMGQPVVWANGQVKYYLDRGALSSFVFQQPGCEPGSRSRPGLVNGTDSSSLHQLRRPACRGRERKQHDRELSRGLGCCGACRCAADGVEQAGRGGFRCRWQRHQRYQRPRRQRSRQLHAERRSHSSSTVLLRPEISSMRSS